MIKLILTGNPLSTQSVYKPSCRGRIPGIYMSNVGKKRKLDYQWQVANQYKGKILEYDIEIEIKLFYGTKRKIDWDNFHKLSMDAMEGIVFMNDSQIKKSTVIMGYDKENPRINLTIKKYIK